MLTRGQERVKGEQTLPDRSLLMANLGETVDVWRLRRDWSVVPFLVGVDGTALPPANSSARTDCATP